MPHYEPFAFLPLCWGFGKETRKFTVSAWWRGLWYPCGYVFEIWRIGPLTISRRIGTCEIEEG